MVAKIAKIQLEMKNGVKVRTISELKDNFDAEKLVGYYLDGKLKKWLETRWYEDEVKALEKLNPEEPLFVQGLCRIFEIEYQETEINLEKILERNARLFKLKQYTEDEKMIRNIRLVAFNQEELAELYDEGEEVIYLCEGTFKIPKSKRLLKYEIIGDAYVEGLEIKEEKLNIDECVTTTCETTQSEIPEDLIKYIGDKEYVELDDFVIWCDYSGHISSYEHDCKVVPFFKRQNATGVDTMDRYKIWEKRNDRYYSLFSLGEKGLREKLHKWKNKLIYRDLEGICIFDVETGRRECIHKDLSYRNKNIIITNSKVSFMDLKENLIVFDLVNNEKDKFVQ